MDLNLEPGGTGAIYMQSQASGFQQYPVEWTREGDTLKWQIIKDKEGKSRGKIQRQRFFPWTE
jgi:hypothetical protein